MTDISDTNGAPTASADKADDDSADNEAGTRSTNACRSGILIHPASLGQAPSLEVDDYFVALPLSA